MTLLPSLIAAGTIVVLSILVKSGIAKNFGRLLLGVEYGRETVIKRSAFLVVAIVAITGYVIVS